MGEDLVRRIKESDDVIDVGAEVIIEALEHLTDFCRTKEVWRRDAVKNTCYAIGEEIYDKGGLSGMENVFREVRYQMGCVATSYLSHFWNGVGYGAWRS